MQRLLAVLAMIIVAGAAQAAPKPTPAHSAANVGFQELRIPNGDDKPLVIGVWYPTDDAASPQPLSAFIQTVAPGGAPSGTHLPLVVMSHGTGGWYGGHYDTALTLAHAGFVVAAVSHTGDTYDDQSRAVRIEGRPRHIRRLIDYMTAEWTGHERIDADRIGAFGFSAGGFTTLVAIGGVPDFSTLPAHWAAHPDYFDSKLLGKAPPAIQAAAAGVSGEAFVHEPRIRAAVIAAPALGFTFSRQGLKDVHVPVQLWRAEFDHILPHPDYAEAVRLALPQAPEFHLVENADHFDFLAPCTDRQRQFAPDICVSRPGFDRAAFHDDFNAQVLAFFRKELH